MRTAARQGGFTLSELMIVVAVVAILAMVSAPSLFEFVRTQRLKGVHAQVVTDMQFARTEAAARNLAINVRVKTASDSSAVSCYILFTDTDPDHRPSQRCDCQQPEGSRCSSADANEVRTVLVERSGGVVLRVPQGQADHFAFDPITGGIILPVSEVGVSDGEPFLIQAALDTARALATSVGVSGRPTACRPAGSTMAEPDCPTAPAP